MATLIEADDPRYAPVCGTYVLDDGRHLFIGGLLGASVVTLHDFETRRIATLVVADDQTSDQLILQGGPSLFEHQPAELTCTLPIGGAPQGADLAYGAGGVTLRGSRVRLETEPVRFSNGDVTLAGTLYLPPETTPPERLPCVVLIHGSGPQERACGRIHAEYFARHGIASLAYDKRGAGESSPGPDDFKLLARDALAGLRAVAPHPRIDPRRIGLCGSSQGGWIAPLAAAEAPDELAFIILIAGPAVSIAEQNRQSTEYRMRAAGFPPEQVETGIQQALAYNELIRTGEGWDEFRTLSERARVEGWQRFALSPDMREPPPKPAKPRRGMDSDPVPVLELLTCPALALFGDRDIVVPAVENAPKMEAAFKLSGHPRHQVIVMPGADHLFHEPDAHTTPGKSPLVRRFLPAYLETMVSWINQLPMR